MDANTCIAYHPTSIPSTIASTRDTLDLLASMQAVGLLDHKHGQNVTIYTAEFAIMVNGVRQRVRGHVRRVDAEAISTCVFSYGGRY
jgi:hypothetical protein